MTIQSIDIKSLRNAEYIQFGRSFLNLTHLSNEKTLKVEDEYKAFDGIVKNIEGIFKTDQGSLLTPIIETLDFTRDTYYIGIYKHIESYTSHFDPAKVAAANILLDSLKIYGTASAVAASSLPAETTSINSWVNDVKTKTNLINATAELGIDAWIDALKAANDELDRKYIERTIELGGANPNTIKDKRNEGNNLYYALRDMLLAQATVSKNADPYPTLINQLNALIDQYNLILTNRAADAARAKKDEEKPNDGN